MSDPVATMLGCLVEKLDQRVAEAQWPSPEAGFAAHVRAATTADKKSIARLARSVDVYNGNGRWSQAPVLAAAGYVLGAGDADEGLAWRWREGVARLSERDPFPTDRTSFFYRPVELFGLAIGAHAAGGQFATWLGGVLTKGEHRVQDDVWHRTLGAAAATTLGEPWSLTRILPDGNAPQIADLALLRWLLDADPATAGQVLGDRVERSDLDRQLLEQALFGPIDTTDVARAAVTAWALRAAVEDTLESAHAARWQLTRTARDAAELVMHICRRFPRYARQLSERHADRAALEINDEYDLQDHLHALLRLHFDDVREEEWTPSYGGTRTRMDFLLKREQTIVETKMTRPRLDQSKVVEELIIDKAHYRQHPDCKTLVCFVYDPDRRLANPDALEHDLADDADELVTRVIVCPSGS